MDQLADTSDFDARQTVPEGTRAVDEFVSGGFLRFLRESKAFPTFIKRVRDGGFKEWRLPAACDTRLDRKHRVAPRGASELARIEK